MSVASSTQFISALYFFMEFTPHSVSSIWFRQYKMVPASHWADMIFTWHHKPSGSYNMFICIFQPSILSHRDQNVAAIWESPCSPSPQALCKSSNHEGVCCSIYLQTFLMAYWFGRLWWGPQHTRQGCSRETSLHILITTRFTPLEMCINFWKGKQS